LFTPQPLVSATPIFEVGPGNRPAIGPVPGWGRVPKKNWGREYVTARSVRDASRAIFRTSWETIAVDGDSRVGQSPTGGVNALPSRLSSIRERERRRDEGRDRDAAAGAAG